MERLQQIYPGYEMIEIIDMALEELLYQSLLPEPPVQLARPSPFPPKNTGTE